MTEIEKAVLTVLVAQIDWDENCLNFAALSEQIGLERKIIRRACRSLTRKGLAAFERGLFNEDGEVAGSGYRATRAGAEALP